MSTILTVAPRELRDLVYRCCRVAGDDPGSAHLLADNVTFAEVHLGGALAAVVPSIARGESGQLLAAHHRLAEAEVAARSNRTAVDARFDPPVPLGAVAGTMWEMAERGALSSGDFEPDDAGVLVALVTVRDGEPADPVRSATSGRWASVHRHGLVVDRGWFSQLETMAAEFLVAEATLDALDVPGD